MTPGEFAAIEARANAASDERLSPLSIADSAADVPALLAVLRERDNTIARVRALIDNPIRSSPHLLAGSVIARIRAALEQEA